MYFFKQPCCVVLLCCVLLCTIDIMLCYVMSYLALLGLFILSLCLKSLSQELCCLHQYAMSLTAAVCDFCYIQQHAHMSTEGIANDGKV